MQVIFISERGVMFHNKLKSDKLWVAYHALPKENPLCFVPTLYYATCFGSQKGPSLKQINNHEAQYNGHLTHALSISYYSLTLDGKLSVNMDFRWKKSRYQWKDIVCLCECVIFQHLQIDLAFKRSHDWGGGCGSRRKNRNENLVFYPLNQGSPTSRI